MDVVRMPEPPEGLRRPTVIAAFEGWNDAGEAATGAVEALMRTTEATRFADLDPEQFFDFQVSRPVVRWDDDVRVLEWPSNTFSYARLDGPRDVVFLHGREPNLRWRTFTEGILHVARRVDAARLITLGALQVDRPHTRRVSMTGSASDEDLARAHGLRRSTYEGPTGIVGVLHQTASEAGLDAVTLWAGVPHYLAGTAYLRASLALAEKAVTFMDADLPLEALAEEAGAQQRDIADLVEEDEELAEYVGELEQRADDHPEPLETDELPSTPVSGEELARELERYLRERPAE